MSCGDKTCLLNHESFIVFPRSCDIIIIAVIIVLQLCKCTITSTACMVQVIVLSVHPIFAYALLKVLFINFM